MVEEEQNEEVIGSLQHSFIQHLHIPGRHPCSARSSPDTNGSMRGRRIGRQMLVWAIERARERGAHLLQLTTGKKRPEVITFYQSQGFVSTHEAMIFHLNQLHQSLKPIENNSGYWSC